MGECTEHNLKCHDCEYKLICGAGCRACACQGGSMDFLGIDGDTCSFFQNGWYEKAKGLSEKYSAMLREHDD